MNRVKLSVLALFLFESVSLTAQNFEVSVSGIKEGDSIRLVVQKSSEFLFKKWVHHNPNGNSVAVFDQLSSGLWALTIDATGYTFPASSVFDFPETTSANVELSPMLNNNYTYEWRDDGSAAGHATQSYVAEPTSIKILNDTVSVPFGFSAIKLRTEYGVLLSDDQQAWSNEDAYRLYKMFTNLPFHPFGEGAEVNFDSGENVRGVFYLTEDELFEDISIQIIDGIKHVTVSQSAFTYAEPQIALLDGIRGKFFSKRLYHAVVNFITDFASNSEMVAKIAKDRFGIEFLAPGPFLEDLMGEDSSDFQEFYNSEKLEILAMFEELPEGFHKQEGLRYLVRRIDGQVDPKFPEAAALAYGSLGTIEFMDKSFLPGNLNETRRIILHEKAHFLWWYTFDESIQNEWIDIGGWFLDPTGPSGWSTYNTTEFVSAYGHDKNPNEDMAESIAIYLTNPDRLINVSMKKYEFIRDRIMHGTRYVAQIREDLTFTVYNLYPDYIFPGKVIGISLSLEGGPEEDKVLNIRALLNSTDPEIDGAAGAYLRFASSIGTVFDVPMRTENGGLDSVLVGSVTISRVIKSGYWNLVRFSVTDQVGNMRYENISTLGIKLFIENPLEDITPPAYNYDFKQELVQDYFAGTNYNGVLDSINGTLQQAIKYSYSWNEKSSVNYGTVVDIKFPNSGGSEYFSKNAWGHVLDETSEVKAYEHYFVIPEYFPTGYYTPTLMYTRDEANQFSRVFFVDQPEDFFIDPTIQPPVNFKDQRDSIYVVTEFPDIQKPVIDINNISISAAPTNPLAPDGETRVDISILARDYSDFVGKESGVYLVEFTLRDPEGHVFGFQTGNSTMNHPDLPNGSWVDQPNYGDDWKIYRFDLLLPKGSIPGKWGLASATVTDLVGNRSRYSFVEYIRFDVIESNIVLEEPLSVEIVDKVINAGNVNGVSVLMSCVPCTGLNYVATIYSRFGGGAVVRNEGTLSANEVLLENLNTTGVLDGEVNLTVQLTDAEGNLIATKSAIYTKDVVYPASYYTRSNLQNTGQSNLDDLIVEVVYEQEDEGGTYSYEMGQATETGSSIISAKGANRNSFLISPSEAVQVYSGSLVGAVSISGIDFSGLSTGFVYGKLGLNDPNGNPGQISVTDFYVLITAVDAQLKVKAYNESDTDYDDDGVANNMDLFPFDARESADADADGIGDNQDTDDDNDLVLDIYDLCPNSEPGALVDATGCVAFSLPANTFSVTVTGASCPGASNGSITLNSSNTDFNFGFSIDGGTVQALTNNSQTLSNLSAGTYSICFSVDGVSNFQRCYTIEIVEPLPLQATSMIDLDGQQMVLNLAGASEYQVVHNGKTFTTSASHLNLELEPGLNQVQVSTGLDCQGIYFEEVFVLDEVKLYPNPTPGTLQLYVAGSDTIVQIQVISLSGQIVYLAEFNIPENRVIEADLNGLSKGSYLISIQGRTVQSTNLILKD